MTDRFSPQQEEALLKLARASIENAFEAKKFVAFEEPRDMDAFFKEKRGTFVTLEIAGKLRGCIGHLEPVQALAKDVYENAFNAAFGDPRFPQLQPEEYKQLDIHISVLSLPQPMEFSSEEDLLEKIRPGVDGLILSDGPNKGTFLPSVWESLPDKQEFWVNLKLKAGLPANHWSSTLKVERYEATLVPKES